MMSEIVQYDWVSQEQNDVFSPESLSASIRLVCVRLTCRET